MTAALQFRSQGLFGALLVLAIASRAADASATLKLKVRSDGQHYTIEWDRSSPELARAAGARLQIVEGNKPPLYMNLTPEQLDAGSMTYGSYPFVENVRFHLELIGVAAVTTDRAAPAPAPARSEAPRTFVPPKSQPSPALYRQAVIHSPPAIAATNLPASLPGIAQPDAPRWKFEAPRQVPAEIAVQPALLDPPLLSYRIPTAPQTALSLLTPPRVPPYPEQPLVPVVAAALASGGLVGIPTGAGVLTITSEPPGATVEINDQPAGTTPVTIQVSPLGIGFTVTLTKPGYLKWTIQSLATSQPAAVHAKLQEIRR